MIQLLSMLLRLVKSINVDNKEELLRIVSNNLREKKDKSIADFFYINSGSIFHMVSDKIFLRAYGDARYVYLNSFLLGDFVKFIYGKSLSKLNAEDFVFDLLQLCEALGKRVFFLGSDEKTLGKALLKIRKEYPKLYTDGYYGYFNSEALPLRKINKFKPDILFVGLGLGKQELWVFENKAKLKIPVVIAIGNFIDILGESRSLPQPFYKNNKIEWLYRLIKEPRRLWKRYVLGGIILLVLFIYALLTRFISFILGFFK